jgi:hypothetical protein
MIVEKRKGWVYNFVQNNPSMQGSFSKMAQFHPTGAEIAQIRELERQERREGNKENPFYQILPREENSMLDHGFMDEGEDEMGHREEMEEKPASQAGLGKDKFDSVLVGITRSQIQQRKKKKKFNAIKQTSFKSEIVEVNPVRENENLIKMMRESQRKSKAEGIEIKSIMIDENERAERKNFAEMMISSLPDQDEVLFFGSTFKMNSIKEQKDRK